MNKEDKYIYWLDMAEYDLSTAEAMQVSGRYLYVAFMCQQSLEKLAKGLYTLYVDEKVPRVHNISFIVSKIQDVLKFNIDEDIYLLFDSLSAYYIEGRYPTFRNKASALIDKEKSQDILEHSKEVFQWMKSLKM